MRKGRMLYIFRLYRGKYVGIESELDREGGRKRKNKGKKTLKNKRGKQKERNKKRN